jgi:hypothetical protein
MLTALLHHIEYCDLYFSRDEKTRLVQLCRIFRRLLYQSSNSSTDNVNHCISLRDYLLSGDLSRGQRLPLGSLSFDVRSNCRTSLSGTLFVPERDLNNDSVGNGLLQGDFVHIEVDGRPILEERATLEEVEDVLQRGDGER